VSETRSRQLNYSEIQSLMLDESSREAKASKITAVLEHFLGGRLGERRIVDVGCSAGLILGAVASGGAAAIGVDIDGPGLERAAERFPAVAFVNGDSEQLPLRAGSVDIVICNQVYEHVVSSERLFAEIKRVLAADGVAYFGLGNRHRLMEPHYGLPLLSWLPPSMADRYVRLARRGDRYHERFRTKRGLRELCAGLQVWDYTYAVLGDPERFDATDVVHGVARSVPMPVWRAFDALMPTYVWVASHSTVGPRGPQLAVPPEHIVGEHT
jgi:SAM-dependent methyltransferase